MSHIGYISLAISNCDNLFGVRLEHRECLFKAVCLIDPFFIYVKSALAIREVKGKAILVQNFLALPFRSKVRSNTTSVILGKTGFIFTPPMLFFSTS